MPLRNTWDQNYGAKDIKQRFYWSLWNSTATLMSHKAVSSSCTSYHHQQSKKSHAQENHQIPPLADLRLTMEEGDEWQPESSWIIATEKQRQLTLGGPKYNFQTWWVIIICLNDPLNQHESPFHIQYLCWKQSPFLLALGRAAWLLSVAFSHFISNVYRWSKGVRLHYAILFEDDSGQFVHNT